MKKRVIRFELEERDIGECDEIRKSMGKILFLFFVFFYFYFMCKWEFFFGDYYM